MLSSGLDSRTNSVRCFLNPNLHTGTMANHSQSSTLALPLEKSKLKMLLVWMLAWVYCLFTVSYFWFMLFILHGIRFLPCEILLYGSYFLKKILSAHPFNYFWFSHSEIVTCTPTMAVLFETGGSLQTASHQSVMTYIKKLRVSNQELVST